MAEEQVFSNIGRKCLLVIMVILCGVQFVYSQDAIKVSEDRGITAVQCLLAYHGYFTFAEYATGKYNKVTDLALKLHLIKNGIDPHDEVICRRFIYQSVMKYKEFVDSSLVSTAFKKRVNESLRGVTPFNIISEESIWVLEED